MFENLTMKDLRKRIEDRCGRKHEVKVVNVIEHEEEGYWYGEVQVEYGWNTDYTTWIVFIESEDIKDIEKRAKEVAKAFHVNVDHPELNA